MEGDVRQILVSATFSQPARSKTKVFYYVTAHLKDRELQRSYVVHLQRNSLYVVVYRRDRSNSYRMRVSCNSQT